MSEGGEPEALTGDAAQVQDCAGDVPRAQLTSLLESASKLVAQAFVHELVVEDRQRILSTSGRWAGFPTRETGPALTPAPEQGVFVQ